MGGDVGAPESAFIDGDGSTTMQKFIEQSISCILDPIALQVEFFHQTAEQLGRSAVAADARIEEILLRLGRHDQFLLETEVNLAQKVDVVKLRREIEGLGFGAKMDRLESGQRSLEEHSSSVDQRLATLDSALQGLRLNLDEGDANTHRLQLKVWHATNLGQRLEATMAEVKDEQSELGSRHHGLVRTLQQMKEQLEAKISGFGKLVSDCQTQSDEVKQLMVEHSRRIGHNEELLAAVPNHKDDFASVHKEVNLVRSGLSSAKEQLNTMVSMGQRSSDIVRRLQGIEEIVEKNKKTSDKEMRESQHDAEIAACETRAVRGDLSDCRETTRTLEAARQSSDEWLQQLERRCADLTAKQDRTSNKAEMNEVALNQVQELQRDCDGKADANGVDVDQVKSHQQRSNRALTEMDLTVQSVRTELAATTEGVAKIVAHLDLAHDYLHGLSKGFQESSKKSMKDQDVRQSPKDVAKGRAPLPTLSTPRPRPLSATLTSHGRRPMSASRTTAASATDRHISEFESPSKELASTAPERTGFGMTSP